MDLQIAPEVAAALAGRRSVVALESTVISHGLPYPHNVELARAMEAEVRGGGATPATIGIVGGTPTVGMTDDDILRFAKNPHVLKLSRRDLGYAAAMGADGATTVAGTMALAAMAGVRIFATGGIGGVHRGARDSWDISADLTELARTPVLVVCAGTKAILDLPATLEYLETAGVPVLGYGTDEFAAFYSRQSGLNVRPAEDAAQVAAVWRAHLALGGGSGMVLAVPPPADVALDAADIEVHIKRALARAAAADVRGQAVTPFLLSAMAEETDGESVRTNVALLRNNARVAASVAAHIERGNRH